ncbi:MAG TPA: Uma2 family endonuclease [Chthonomonadaceae bacterium]|nr:Uma2 family endonuclease [Chthonomonadaceae bacterium]
MSAALELEQTYTADDLLAFPGEFRYELVRGRLREMPPTGGPHGETTSQASCRIAVFVQDESIGRCYAAETGFQIARKPDTVLAPDFAFIAKERVLSPLPEGYVPVVPDLVIETRSPSQTGASARAKIDEWLAAGVRMALDIDPGRRRLTVFRPGRLPLALEIKDTFDGEDVLPGFALRVSRIFE